MVAGNRRNFIIESVVSESEFIRDYGQFTTDQLSEKYGVAGATIDLYALRLREAGVTVVAHRPKIAAEEFQAAWNASNSLNEVSEALGIQDRSKRSLSSMASQYRRKGWNLKRFSLGDT